MRRQNSVWEVGNGRRSETDDPPRRPGPTEGRRLRSWPRGGSGLRWGCRGTRRSGGRTLCLYTAGDGGMVRICTARQEAKEDQRGSGEIGGGGQFGRERADDQTGSPAPPLPAPRAPPHPRFGGEVSSCSAHEGESGGGGLGLLHRLGSCFSTKTNSIHFYLLYNNTH